MLPHRLGEGGQSPARVGQQPGPLAPGRGEGAAGRRHQVERGQRPVEVAAAAADPGQAERRRGDVVGVGARAGGVERLGHVELAAGLAGQGQRQLGGQLAGHLAVDRVEGGLGAGRVVGAERGEPGQPHGAPLPRVGGEHVARPTEATMSVRPASSAARPVASSTSGGGRRAPCSSTASRATGSSTLTVRSQPACGSLSSTRSAGRWPQTSGSSVTRGESNSREDVECWAAPVCPSPAATTSRSTPSSCTRISSAEANRSAGSGAQALASSR